MDHQPWEMIVEDALRHGDVAVARQVVTHELRRNPRNGTAWHILSTIVTDPTQREDCVRRAHAFGMAVPGFVTPLGLPRASAAAAPQPLAQPPHARLAVALIVIGLLVCLSAGGVYWYAVIRAQHGVPQVATIVAPVSPEVPRLPLDVPLLRVGGGQHDDEVMVYFELENASDVPLHDVPYTMTVHAIGTTTVVASNTLELLLPHQRLIVTDGLYVGVPFHYASVDVQIGHGFPITLPAAPTPLQVVQDRRFTASAASGGITGESTNQTYPSLAFILDNPNTVVVTDTTMAVLAYNNQDRVIGAGSALMPPTAPSLPNHAFSGLMPSLYLTMWSSEEPTRYEFSAGFTLGSFPVAGGSQREKDPKPPSQEEYIPGSSVRHVEGSVNYPSLPPTSGPHSAYPATWGYYPHSAWSDEALVHNLEHGGGIIFVNPTLITPTEHRRLVATFNTLYARNDHLIMSQRFDLDATVAVTAWEYRLMLRDQIDVAAIEQFFSDHIARGPECVRLRCPK